MRAFTDAERLDFLDECNTRLNRSYGTKYRWRVVLNHNVNRLMLDHMTVDLADDDGSARGLTSCREAIDAKMRECGHVPRSSQPSEAQAQEPQDRPGNSDGEGR